MKRLNNDIKYLIGLWIILFISIFLTLAHHGHLVVDCGREVYYPTQILLGKVLYKDLFNIYGPCSYMFNAVLFKFFGTNLNVLYAAGSVCTFLLVTFVYLISRKFLSDFLSFSVAFLTIAVGVFNPGVFDYILPYSYGMLYGLVSFLISVFLIIKYQNTPEKVSYLYLSCFFAGLCVANKYEFLPYLLVILYVMLKSKALKFNEYLYALLSLIFVPAVCFSILFIQGLSLETLIGTSKILSKMSHTQTLKYFYKRMGVYFCPITIPLLVGSFSFVAFTLLCFMEGFKTNLRSRIILIFGEIFLFMSYSLNLSGYYMAFLPMFILIMSIWRFKSIKNNYPLLILIASSILFGMKVFAGLIVYNYGAFFAPFITIAALALFVNVFKKEELNQTAIAVYVIFLALFIGYNNLDQMKQKTVEIKTSRGKIYSQANIGNANLQLIDFINKKTKKTDTVVIFPEGPFINFLTNRKTDDFYNSLIPLYVETFGDEKIIGHFRKTKPEYIIFNNWDTSEYYFKNICSDYAVSFCNYVAENYMHEKTIDTGFRYLIFKRK